VSDKDHIALLQHSMGYMTLTMILLYHWCCQTAPYWLGWIKTSV